MTTALNLAAYHVRRAAYHAANGDMAKAAANLATAEAYRKQAA